MVAWLCFFGGVVGFLCFCGGVVVFLWCGGVFVVVFLWWCGCVSVVVFLWWCFCREALEESVVEKCWGDVLWRSVGEERCRDVR